MITNTGAYSTEKIMELNGLSTDEKPIGKYGNTKVPNASTFLEMDTSKVFIYDAENEQWHEL